MPNGSKAHCFTDFGYVGKYMPDDLPVHPDEEYVSWQLEECPATERQTFKATLS